ncbi:Tn3 family transposase [Streptomyces sp. WZ-12]|uniref:Tn3 family transposase n=1 Tax=Streptomyces sp. WZ-12 TaxID=3030210 RepID=UPI00238157B2|nr:Tn3 family transposase [Streptomyces sp. WZ-12]
MERTAYPRFKRIISERELREFFTVAPEERVWVEGRARWPGHRLALAVMLKSCARLGYFPPLETVPQPVVAHVRSGLGLGDAVLAETGSPRTAKHHRTWVRERLGLVRDPVRAREVAARAMTAAAPVKAHSADLVNVALEELVRAGLELPGFSTLDRMAAAIRTRVEGEICAGIVSRMSEAARIRLAALLEVADGERRSVFDSLKEPGRRATWSKFRAHAERMERLDALGDSGWWVGKTASAKAASLAAQARVLSVGEMKDIAEPRRTAMLACLVAELRSRARDEFVTMLCKRMARHLKRAEEELAEIEKRQKEVTEQLIAAYRDVLAALKDPVGNGDGSTAGSLDDVLALKLAREAVKRAGGFDAQLGQIEALAAHHGNNFTPLVERFFRPDRPTMFKLARRLTFVATSQDRRVLDALEHALAHQNLTCPLIPDTPPPTALCEAADEAPRALDLSFASKNWLKTVYAKDVPGQLVRRHFETMVFTYLVEDLRCGDIAVVGCEEYGDWTTMLLPWDECVPRLAAFCVEAGLPPTAAGFTARLRQQLTEVAQEVDDGYPDNADLTVDPLTGVPSLKARKGTDRTASAEAVDAELSRRLPARSALEHLARAAHWTGWWHRPGPLSGSDPKLKDPLSRYVITAFTYGCNLGPAQAARHMRGAVTAHELGAIAQRHFTTRTLGKAGADVISTYTDLELTAAWGDGSVAAVDGTMMDTVIDNLLAETSIRYGGFGGIAYHLVADTYIALFSRFIPCGAWEAVYLIDAMLANESDVQPSTVHADTQGQSFPVFGLAHTLGIDLLPRIRNFHDLTFHRPDPGLRYQHIDPLFSTDPRTAIDWPLIENHWPDLIQVALSVKEGTVSSVTLLRRLNNRSRKNQIYKVFREVGRAVRTIVLLRYLSEPSLREQISRATNKAEAYNGFTKWLAFGNHGLLSSRDPEQQEKAVKFLDLVASSIIFSTTIDMTGTLRQMVSEGWTVLPEDLAVTSPHRRENVLRFGDYDTDSLHIPPGDYDPTLP